MPSAALSRLEKVGYALGDAGLNLYWRVFDVFLLVFYTDVFGISPTAAGTMLLVARIWDGINDPVMGLLADRTRTRWGSYRPWLVGASLPLALAGVLAFTTPDWAATPNPADDRLHRRRDPLLGADGRDHPVHPGAHLGRVVQKIGAAAGGYGTGVLLDVVGYVPHQAQTEGALTGILLLAHVLPGLVTLGAVGLMALYDLSDERMQELEARYGEDHERLRHPPDRPDIPA